MRMHSVSDKLGTCPNGHENPEGWELCGDCGAPIPSASPRVWYRGPRAVLALLVALIAVAAVVVVVVRTGSGHQAEPSSSTAEQSALAVWWSSANESVTDLQTALDDSQTALQRTDNSRLEAACQTMHDVARVDLQALMPSPDRNLSAELRQSRMRTRRRTCACR
jgi:hypothetical protein